jgi:hypothetical protein
MADSLSSHYKAAPLNGILPGSDNIIFSDSSFFQRHGASAKLPSPAEVRNIAAAQMHPRALIRTRPKPISFPNLGLMVKFGTEVTTSEARSLLIVRNLLSSAVLVPDVFSWCIDDGQAFIYMELIEWITLEQSWHTLHCEERVSLCR